MSFDFLLQNNDLEIGADGNIKTITNTQKLRQDVIKVILTTLGSNRFHPWYGCSISEDAIGKNIPDNMLFLDIETSIRQSLDRLQKLQQQQQTTQEVSLSEMIHSVGDISIYRNPDDLRQIKIDIVILSRELTQINESFNLSQF